MPGVLGLLDTLKLDSDYCKLRFLWCFIPLNVMGPNKLVNKEILLIKTYILNSSYFLNGLGASLVVFGLLNDTLYGVESR